MSEIRYKYAYDENGDFIDIESVSRENRHEKQFHCISCGEEMIPKLGKVRTHHFAHKVADVSCNKETYLHKIGKWLLKSKFDDSESFVIEYQRKVKCKNCGSCPFYKEDECIKDEYEGFDLKKYYDTCTEEQQVGEYIADLLLTNSKKEDRKPVLIEIRVSHECTEEKQASGAKIIELRVKSEDDLLKIADSKVNCVLCKNSGKSLSGHTGYCNRREIHENSDAVNPIEANECPYYFFDGIAYEGRLRMFSNVHFSVVKRQPI